MMRVEITKDNGVLCRQKMLEMINFVFSISAFMVSSFRRGSDSASGDDGCLEKVIRGHGGGLYVL